VCDFLTPPFGRRRIVAVVWARGHLFAGRFGAGRLGAVLITCKNRQIASEGGTNEKTQYSRNRNMIHALKYVS